jgi:hypothetical protein
MPVIHASAASDALKMLLRELEAADGRGLSRSTSGDPGDLTRTSSFEQWENLLRVTSREIEAWCPTPTFTFELDPKNDK